MEEVRGAGGPWTVAGDPQEGGEGGGAGVCVGGVWCWQGAGKNGYKWIDGRTEMKGRWRRLVKDLVER